MDDGGADFDFSRVCADGGEQRKGRGELACEMVDAEIGAIETEAFGFDGEIDGLKEDVGRGTRLGAGRRRPVAEGQEAELFHGARL